ncbi:carbohydrate kinase family protein [Dactylosporangium sucinum]|uniref:Carbohydrate kinase PfkB domain-containing protein n=1 Tax=Dactylosporangium sucinum TaxID=1424081 RepID=A0A917UE66_9ACTN|nr:carbohydrate kinase family protein [Dactylosporangium sucinum]GGM81402.1 hypothetical protein GCM10007977_098490 [Dactylosporangium sucinum]
MSAGRAVVVGTVALDLVAAEARARTARAAVGNSGANIAVRLAAAGWRVELVCLVGDDPAADLVREDLTRWGVGTHGTISRAGYLTPRVFLVAGTPGTAARWMNACPRCGRPRGHTLQIPALDELPAAVLDAAASADLIVADVAGATADALIDRCAGLRWFEASLTEADPDVARRTGAACDVVKVSAEEVEHYAGALAAIDGRTRLQVVTDGPRGLRLRRRTVAAPGWPGWSHRPVSEPVEVVDTMGAGDAFTATVAAALVGEGWRGEPGLPDILPILDVPAAVRTGQDGDRVPDLLDSVLHQGQRAAAMACRFPGARGDMRPREEGRSAWLPGEHAWQCGRCEAEQASGAPGTDGNTAGRRSGRTKRTW